MYCTNFVNPILLFVAPSMFPANSLGRVCLRVIFFQLGNWILYLEHARIV
jgi:hypothetical protein